MHDLSRWVQRPVVVKMYRVLAVVALTFVICYPRIVEEASLAQSPTVQVASENRSQTLLDALKAFVAGPVRLLFADRAVPSAG